MEDLYRTGIDNMLLGGRSSTEATVMRYLRGLLEAANGTAATDSDEGGGGGEEADDQRKEREELT